MSTHVNVSEWRHSFGLLPFLAVLACCLATWAEAAEQSRVTEKQWAVAINFAGRQRMLSQKMTKEFLLVLLKVDDEENRALCKETSAMFNDTLKRLMRGDAEMSLPPPPSAEIQSQLAAVEAIWNTFMPEIDRGIESGSASAEALVQIAQLNTTLLTAMDSAVTMYQRESQRANLKTLGAVVNVAGRQRMLIQKMSKEILLVALGVEPAVNQKRLQESKAMFQVSLLGLIQGSEQLGLPPTESKLVLTQLRRVGELWKQFNPLVDEAAESSEISPALVRRVADLNSELLREMNRAVTLYEAGAQN